MLDHGCGDLMVIAWQDVDDEVCDENSSTHTIGGINMVEEEAANFVHAGTSSNSVLIHGLAITFGILSIVAIVCMVKCLRNIDKAYPRVALGAVAAEAAAEAQQFETQTFSGKLTGTSMMHNALQGRKRTRTNTAQMCETDSESETDDGDD